MNIKRIEKTITEAIERTEKLKVEYPAVHEVMEKDRFFSPYVKGFPTVVKAAWELKEKHKALIEACKTLVENPVALMSANQMGKTEFSKRLRDVAQELKQLGEIG